MLGRGAAGQGKALGSFVRLRRIRTKAKVAFFLPDQNEARHFRDRLAVYRELYGALRPLRAL